MEASFQWPNVGMGSASPGDLLMARVRSPKRWVMSVVDQEFVKRAQALLPVLKERAAEAERLRMIPSETIADFQDAGLFRALQPARYGGLEVDPMSFYEAVMLIGTVCASSAWVLSVVGVHSWQLGLFDPRAQNDVWGSDTSVLISSSYATAGTVDKVDGGYVLNGSWPFSSGSDHCQWAFLGGIVARDPDQPAPMGEDGRELLDVRTFLVPLHECEREDNWYVAGLCGSGSKQIVVRDVFVPEYRTHRFLDVRSGDNPGLRQNTSTLFKLPFGSLFCYAIAAPIIGVARGMYDAFTAHVRERAKLAYSRGRQEDGLVQMRIARTAAELDAAVLQLRHNIEQMQDTVARGGNISLDRRSRYRWDAANASRIATKCVDRVFEAAGGRAIFLSNPMQRAFRDAHAMRAHANNNPETAAQIFGRAELGLPNREFLI